MQRRKLMLASSASKYGDAAVLAISRSVRTQQGQVHKFEAEDAVAIDDGFSAISIGLKNRFWVLKAKLRSFKRKV